MMISPFGPTAASCLMPPPNLLPIPALDGGRMIFLLIEVIVGKPVPEKYEGIVELVGAIFLIGLMVVVLFHDVGRLFK